MTGIVLGILFIDYLTEERKTRKEKSISWHLSRKTRYENLKKSDIEYVNSWNLSRKRRYKYLIKREHMNT